MKLLLTALAVLPCLALAQSRSVRFWFGYGDASTATLARISGFDPSAQVGRPVLGSRLAVPTSGGTFKVGLWCQMDASDGLPAYSGGPEVNIAFDRTFCGSANQNPPLNGDSFQKVRPAGANPNDYVEAFSDGPVMPAWRNSSSIADWNNDGVQDTARMAYLQSLPSAWRQGVQGFGESLRPVGLATGLRPRLIEGPNAGMGSGFKLPNATPFRIIDVNWVSMLNLGETYGDRPGETGLSITTSQQIGLANTTAIVGSASHTGSRYTLVAVVPEPASAVGLGLAVLVLLRRRAR